MSVPNSEMVKSTKLAHRNSAFAWWISCFRNAAAILTVILVADSVRLGSAGAATRHLLGDRVQLSVRELSRNSLPTGYRTVASVRVHNLGLSELTVRGTRTECGCLTVTGVPSQIPAGGSVILLFEMDSINSHSAAHPVEVFFDGSPRAVRIEIDFSGA